MSARTALADELRRDLCTGDDYQAALARALTADQPATPASSGVCPHCGAVPSNMDRHLRDRGRGGGGCQVLAERRAGR